MEVVVALGRAVFGRESLVYRFTESKHKCSSVNSVNTSSTVGGVKQTDTSESQNDSISPSTV